MNLDTYRTLLIAATAGAVPLVALLWSISDHNPYEAYGYPLYALFLAWILWALVRNRLATQFIFAVAFWVTLAFWLGIMATRLHLGAVTTPPVERLTPDVFMVFLVMGVLTHILFSTRTAVRASAGLVLATLLTGASWIAVRWYQGASVEGVGRLATYEGILAVAVLMLYILARRKDDYAAAVLETERLRELAYRDALTRLPNRRQLEDSLQRFVALAERHDHALSVAFLDLDRFKDVNDAHGHHVGDRVLEEIRKGVRPLLRTGDVFGRWGGEEFLIIAPNTDHAQALTLAERLRDAIERHPYPKGVTVTASFGVASHEPSTTVDQLLERADARLYQAKWAGRNRVAGAHTTRGGKGNGLSAELS